MDDFFFRKSGKLNACGITQDIKSITITTTEDIEMDVSEAIKAVRQGMFV